MDSECCDRVHLLWADLIAEQTGSANRRKQVPRQLSNLLQQGTWLLTGESRLREQCEQTDLDADMSVHVLPPFIRGMRAI
jgi:hypothetical protein